MLHLEPGFVFVKTLAKNNLGDLVMIFPYFSARVVGLFEGQNLRFRSGQGPPVGWIIQGMQFPTHVI